MKFILILVLVFAACDLVTPKHNHKSNKREKSNDESNLEIPKVSDADAAFLQQTIQHLVSILQLILGNGGGGGDDSINEILVELKKIDEEIKNGEANKKLRSNVKRIDNVYNGLRIKHSKSKGLKKNEVNQVQKAYKVFKKAAAKSFATSEEKKAKRINKHTKQQKL